MTRSASRREHAEREKEGQEAIASVYRTIGDALGFWRCCGLARCRRNHTCRGDLSACFMRHWAHVHPDDKFWLQAVVKARIAGASADEADCAGRAALERARAMEEKFENQT